MPFWYLLGLLGCLPPAMSSGDTVNLDTTRQHPGHG
jgi:hypothetical protein